MSTSHQICLLYILSMSMFPVRPAFPPSLRYTLPIAMNKITDVNITCDPDNFNVTLTMQSPFKGLLFAKDFAQECKTVGSFSDRVTINLPTHGCGVRLISVPGDNGSVHMLYTVHLVVQQDRFLRQISDQEKIIRCHLKDDAFLLKSKALVKTLRSELKAGQISHRVGRMRDAGWSKELEGKQLEEELNEALSAARAWMEIVPEQDGDKPSETLQVGETALLTVKSTLPAGIGWKVVDCLAHDGLGDSSQKLLDDRGCPVDELLMPPLIYGPIRPIALMRHQEASTRFPAFKFPDRDRLHLACGLQLCKGPCEKVICNKDDTFENRTSRKLIDASDGDILDRLEVFNSVEVLAPEIDDLEHGDRFKANDPETYPFTNIPGDRTFCVSPDKMAIAFCILGFIFLIAVIIAVCSMLRSKRYGDNTPYYSRSLFSSSSTSGSAFGSRLLLNESPCLGPSTSRRLPYGRIL